MPPDQDPYPWVRVNFFLGLSKSGFADGPALVTEAGIVHLRLACLEVGEVGTKGLIVGVQLLQGAQFSQQRAWSLGQQAVDPLPAPGHGLGVVLTPQRLRHYGNVLGGMGKIEDAHRFGAVVIGQLLQPVGAVHDRRYFPGVFQATVMGFGQG